VARVLTSRDRAGGGWIPDNAPLIGARGIPRSAARNAAAAAKPTSDRGRPLPKLGFARRSSSAFAQTHTKGSAGKKNEATRSGK